MKKVREDLKRTQDFERDFSQRRASGEGFDSLNKSYQDFKTNASKADQQAAKMDTLRQSLADLEFQAKNSESLGKSSSSFISCESS